MGMYSLENDHTESPVGLNANRATENPPRYDGCRWRRRSGWIPHKGSQKVTTLLPFDASSSDRETQNFFCQEHDEPVRIENMTKNKAKIPTALGRLRIALFGAAAAIITFWAIAGTAHGQ